MAKVSARAKIACGSDVADQLNCVCDCCYEFGGVILGSQDTVERKTGLRTGDVVAHDFRTIMVDLVGIEPTTSSMP
jgi:hypothetical protein